MGIFRDFLRRLLGMSRPSRDDPELKERLDRLAQEALQEVRGEGKNALPEDGRRRQKLPRPANVRQLGENSPMVVFQQDNAAVMMDWDAFDYTYGDADGPDPAQRDLDVLLPKVTRVCVLEGAMFRGRALGGPVLADARDPAALRELAACLQIDEDSRTFNHCGCLGGPTLELYAGPEHLATLGLQHGRAVRWKHWYHDAQLRAGDRLTRWLHDQGVDPARLGAIYQRGNNFLFAEPGAAPAHQQAARQLCAQAQQRAEQGDLAEALRLCTRALERDPDHTEAYALRAQVHYHAGRLPEAGADCTAAVDGGLRHAEVYFLRAITLDGAGRLEEAAADCSMALHLNPEHAGAYNSRGLVRGRLGQLDEALNDFAEAVRLAPKWFLPYLQRAQLAHGRGDMDAALADYDRAVELAEAASPAGSDPMVALAYCRRGDARHDQFREEEAEADFAAARRHHPEAAAGYLGETWLRRGNYGRALEAFDQLVELRPEDAQGYVGRGLAHEVQGDLEQAAADFSTAISLRPDGAGAYLLRARVRHRQDRTDEALADLTEHLRLNPADTAAYLFRSHLHKLRQDLPAALEDLNAAHRAAPGDPQACNNLAWMLATCADPKFRDGPRAVALARQACEATGWKHPFCLGTLGAALAETGAFDEAVQRQAQALELYPEQEKAAGRARLELYKDCRPYRE
jgi:tetratricopeptide (TPR) repeat protein